MIEDLKNRSPLVFCQKKVFDTESNLEAVKQKGSCDHWTDEGSPIRDGFTIFIDRHQPLGASHIKK